MDLNGKSKQKKVRTVERKQNENAPNWATAKYSIGSDGKLLTWRPKLDKAKLAEEISEYLCIWCKLNDILAYVDLPQSTYHDWLKNDEEFNKEMNKAKAKFQIDCHTTFHARLMNPNNKDITTFLMKTMKPEEEEDKLGSSFLEMMKGVAIRRIEEDDQRHTLEQEKKKFEDEKNRFEEERRKFEDEKKKFEEEKQELANEKSKLEERKRELDQERKKLMEEKEERGVEKKVKERKKRISEEKKRTKEEREEIKKKEQEEIKNKIYSIDSVTRHPNDKTDARLRGGGKRIIEELNDELRKWISDWEQIKKLNEVMGELVKYWLFSEQGNDQKKEVSPFS